jgi:hypothetical protein
MCIVPAGMAPHASSWQGKEGLWQVPLALGRARLTAIGALAAAAAVAFVLALPQAAAANEPLSAAEGDPSLEATSVAPAESTAVGEDVSLEGTSEATPEGSVASEVPIPETGTTSEPRSTVPLQPDTEQTSAGGEIAQPKSPEERLPAQDADASSAEASIGGARATAQPSSGSGAAGPDLAVEEGGTGRLSAGQAAADVAQEAVRTTSGDGERLVGSVSSDIRDVEGSVERLSPSLVDRVEDMLERNASPLAEAIRPIVGPLGTAAVDRGSAHHPSRLAPLQLLPLWPGATKSSHAAPSGSHLEGLDPRPTFSALDPSVSVSNRLRAPPGGFPAPWWAAEPSPESADSGSRGTGDAPTTLPGGFARSFAAAAGSTTFAGLLAALLVLSGLGSGRQIRLPSASVRPAPFIALLERPG